MLLVLHGLEGTGRSHYVAGLFGQARARGWRASVVLLAVYSWLVLPSPC